MQFASVISNCISTAYKSKKTLWGEEKGDTCEEVAVARRCRGKPIAQLWSWQCSSGFSPHNEKDGGRRKKEIGGRRA
jgi:hypothetical protein